MLVSRDVIQEIKNRLDIVDIIRDYINSLKKVGKNWVGLCPFHNDHNPSLNISPDIGIFKCFSCGESGDIIGFIQKIENISFYEATKILAKKAGIQLDISPDDTINYQKKDELLHFNSRLIKLFQYFLLEKKEGEEALKYLQNRGIDRSLIEIFKIGYAPKEFNRLTNIFFKKGFKEDFLIETGIVSKNEKGIRPLFINRIVFPIINQREECVGFGARSLSSQIMPKYINTPETILYKKSMNLFGINIAKNTIRQEKKAYLVEGYMDVISCYKNGLRNSVAPCGTAVTKDQILLLNRYAEEVILFLDGDEAGKKGAERALKEFADTLIKKYVLVLPDNLDPDDYFKNNSIDDFKKLEKNKIDGFDFLVKYKTKNIDQNDYNKLIVALNSIFEYITQEENEVIRNSLVERLANILKLDKGVVANEFLTYKNKIKYNKKISGDNERENNKKYSNKILKREIDLLLFLLHLNNTKEIINKTSLKEEHFQEPVTQELFKMINNEKILINIKNFIDYIDDNIIKNYIQNRLFGEDFKSSEEVLINNTIDRIIFIIKEYYKEKNKNISNKIKIRQLYQDNESIKKLQEEKTINSREILKLSKLQELKR